MRSSAGEHLVDIEGVTGSIPVASTISFNDLADFSTWPLPRNWPETRLRSCCLASKSSSGVSRTVHFSSRACLIAVVRNVRFEADRLLTRYFPTGESADVLQVRSWEGAGTRFSGAILLLRGIVLPERRRPSSAYSGFTLSLNATIVTPNGMAVVWRGISNIGVAASVKSSGNYAGWDAR